MSEFHPVLSEEQLARSRQLRKDSTFPERRLWGCLRGGRLCGLKFRRQFCVGPYVVDFYCHAKRLVIELDGDSHIGRARYDLAREAYLQSQGLTVFRVGNDDVLRDLETVLRGILLICAIDPDTGRSSDGPISSPHPNPLPEGEGTV
jgi:very-short-patch-repair endonuclease